MKAPQRRFGPVIRYDGYRFHFDPTTMPEGTLIPETVWVRELANYHDCVLKRILLYSHPSACDSQDFVGHAEAHEDHDRVRRRSPMTGKAS